MTRVLVVDDEVETLDLFRIILEMAGYEAITVLNSTDALMMAELERPDCVLLDIMMPYLDGFTLCKLMRLHPATATLPIVFFTAYRSLDLEDRRKEAGADFVVLKPVSMDKLVSAVQQALAMPNRPKPPVGKTGLLRAKTGMLGSLPDIPAGKIVRPANNTRPVREERRTATRPLYRQNTDSQTKATAPLNPDRLNSPSSGSAAAPAPKKGTDYP
jgi:CheY-like chemotaxis protein